MSASAERLAGWIGRQLAAAGGRGLVVGLSGGLDSAVVLRLGQMAAGDQLLAVILPCHSDSTDEADAMLVAEQFGVQTVRADLTLARDGLHADLSGALASLPESLRRHTGPPDSDEGLAAHAAVIPRLRMLALHYFAERLSFLVAGAATRTDLVTGAFTRFGDSAADLLPLGGLLKQEVRVLAAGLGIPRQILDKPAGRGLRPGQPDDAALGFTSADLERYLALGPEGVSPALALRVERSIRHAERRRELPPIPEF
jgi:NAD+ synthase